ncbi:MAG: porin [Hyphomicrobium sp.]
MCGYVLSCLSPVVAWSADLGGECCGDLEERVAELEATTARKGNRKVSLNVSGWVNNQIMRWDDGHESNTYIVDQLPDLTSRIGFNGSAEIRPGTKAGYQLTLALDYADAFLVDQNDPNAGTGPFLIHSYWYLEDKNLGKLSVGFLQHASDNPTFDVDRSGTIFSSNPVIFDGSSMFLRPEGGSGPGYSDARWRDFAFCESIQLGIMLDCAGDRRNAVRYDTPSWNGLTLSTSWGEDDFWDVKAVWNTEVSGFLLGLSGSYTWSNDKTGNGPAELWQTGLFVKHQPTGLFALFAYNDEKADLAGKPDGHAWYLKAGLAQKWFPLGTSYIYGDGAQGLDQYGGFTRGTGQLCGAFDGVGGSISDACAGAADATVNLTESTFTRWGVILQQDIDAAAMTVWLKYYKYSLEADFLDSKTGLAATQDFHDLDMITFGAAIFF